MSRMNGKKTTTYIYIHTDSQEGRVLTDLRTNLAYQQRMRWHRRDVAAVYTMYTVCIMVSTLSRTCINRVYVWSHIYDKIMDQPGKVANPARGQLTGKINISLSAFAPDNLVSRDGFGNQRIHCPPETLLCTVTNTSYGLLSSEKRKQKIKRLSPPPRSALHIRRKRTSKIHRAGSEKRTEWTDGHKGTT